MIDFGVLYERVRKHAFAAYSFPTCDELDGVGLSAEDFVRRYVLPAKCEPPMTVQEHAKLVLESFWKDFPAMRPK